jgi:hypothetical protein
MALNRNRLYLILFIACLAGYIWLLSAVLPLQSGNEAGQGVCIIKRVTGIPCPSCGSTRAVEALLHGDLFRSLWINPFGIIVGFIMVVSPFWIGADLWRNGDSLYRSYRLAETYLRKPWIAIPLIGLVLSNWIWNIAKGY